MRVIIFGILLSLSLNAAATDRTSKIQSLMELQGLLVMWDQQMAASRQYGEQQAQQMLDQITQSLIPSAEFEAKFRGTFEIYLAAVQSPWVAQDLVDVWADKYGSKFSDQELDELLVYYSSPLGKKDVAATQSAVPEFTDHFFQLAKPIGERALTEYIQNLKALARECNCAKN